MSDPVSWLASASSVLTYGLPVGILAVLIGAWLLGRIDHAPPLLESVGPDRSWVKGPIDVVDAAVRSDRYEPAIVLAQQRLDYALYAAYKVTLKAPPLFWKHRSSVPPTLVALLKTGEKLRRARYYAWRAEIAELPEFLVRWRKPVWQALVRGLFDSALSDLETLLPPLEAAV